MYKKLLLGGLLGVTALAGLTSVAQADPRYDYRDRNSRYDDHRRDYRYDNRYDDRYYDRRYHDDRYYGSNYGRYDYPRYNDRYYDRGYDYRHRRNKNILGGAIAGAIIGGVLTR